MDRDAILQKVIEVVNDTLDIADGTELTAARLQGPRRRLL